MVLLQLLATGAAAALSAGALVAAARMRTRRHLNQLPLITLGPNRLGVSAVISPVGATIVKLVAPAADGAPVDVALGFERAATYALLKGTPYFGAVVGRVANRIAKGRFTLDGREHRLAVNNGPNALHGGPSGFHSRVFKVEATTGSAAERRTAGGAAAANGGGDADDDASGGGGGSVVLTYTSRDGEEGYPGNLKVTVTYELPGDLPELRISMRATTDAATPVNLAQHTYFNLAGHGAGDVLGHVVTVNATHYTPVDGVQIPTGEVAPVEGTPFDFRAPRAIGARIGELPHGYDHNFALFGLDKGARHIVKGGVAAATPRLAAEVTEPTRGIRLRVLTTAPGMQFYTGGFLSGDLPGTKDGARYRRFAGFAMETQGFPDAINQPGFPSVVLRPGETYRHDTIYSFGLAAADGSGSGSGGGGGEQEGAQQGSGGGGVGGGGVGGAAS